MDNVYGQIIWKPMEMIDLKWFKEAVVAYEVHLSSIRQFFKYVDYSEYIYSKRFGKINIS